jgi:hypothetical protein
VGIVLGVDKNKETARKKQYYPHNDPEIGRIVQEKRRTVRQLLIEIENR